MNGIINYFDYSSHITRDDISRHYEFIIKLNNLPIKVKERIVAAYFQCNIDFSLKNITEFILAYNKCAYTINDIIIKRQHKENLKRKEIERKEYIRECENREKEKQEFLRTHCDIVNKVCRTRIDLSKQQYIRVTEYEF